MSQIESGSGATDLSEVDDAAVLPIVMVDVIPIEVAMHEDRLPRRAHLVEALDRVAEQFGVTWVQYGGQR